MSDDAHQIALLHSAPGPAGSGQQRDGAAMCLRKVGLLSNPALEV